MQLMVVDGFFAAGVGEGEGMEGPDGGGVEAGGAVDDVGLRHWSLILDILVDARRVK